MDVYNNIIEVHNETPKEFPFPFPPYSIQEQLMKNIYSAIEGRKLAIFESPTGTGKSMSLICGAIKWLLDMEAKIKNSLQTEISKVEKELGNLESSKSVDWFNEHANDAKLKKKKHILQSEWLKLAKHEKKIEDILEKSKALKIEENKNVKKLKFINGAKVNSTLVAKEISEVNKPDENDDEDDILDDFEEKVDKESDSESEEEEENVYKDIKIFFCSRTHSQLSQFVGEIQKSPYSNNIRVISLASRQNYCINESVQKLKSLSLINEKCKDLQKHKKGKITRATAKGEVTKKQKTSSGCPYLQQSQLDVLRLTALTEIQDVETLVDKGKEMKACAYYASRSAVSDSQIVLVPYNTLLHKGTREACGISLTNNIVIIDEAHNLLDTISHIHSCEVTGLQLSLSYSQLQQYQNKYHSKFTPKNILFLKQLMYIINKLLLMLGGKGGCNPADSNKKLSDVKLWTLPDFIMTSEIDNMNLYKILEISKMNRITQKLQGFIGKYNSQVVIHQKVPENGIKSFLKNISSAANEVKPVLSQQLDEIKTPKPDPEMTSNNPILSVVSFIEALTNHCEDGRVVCSKLSTVGKSSLKFLLLNPAAHFSDIIKEARCVIVAGGTMQPITEFKQQLFLSAGADSSRITSFSCDHVIPPSNILPLIVSNGPSGKLLDFSFKNRNSKDLQQELGRIILNISKVVPAGIVCFFASYEYEKSVFEFLESDGTIEKLQKIKKVFREPKKSSEVDKVLQDFSTAILDKETRRTGAILFSVVGGKLSEGLNFSDDLGRCVIVVGMPYPNITSPELQEKMNFLNKHEGAGAGNIYYENLCMKAVNQSIGRAVRHKADYSTVLLLDTRYARNQTQAQLPQWIQRSLRCEDKFGPVVGQLAKFFASKKSLVAKP